MTDERKRDRIVLRLLARGVKWGALLLVIVGVVYWLKFSPVPVLTYAVETGPIVAEVMGTGTLEARVSATVSSKISGRIAHVLVDQGETVSQGDRLVQLDDAELKQQVEIADANVAAAQAAIARLKADKGRTTAVFEQAERHHARIKSLIEQGASTQEELEKGTESLAVAVADVGRAEAAITEGQKGLVSAEKTLEYHRARLLDTRIDAPFSGLIVARHRETGDVVVPGSTILTLISTDVLWISAWVDETAMSRLKPGQPVRVFVRSEPHQTYPGKVIRLGREADRETREFIVDVEVLELPTNWAVGQRAEVFIETDRKEEVQQISARLLVRTESGFGVFISDDGVARFQPLSLGLRGGEMVEVLEGLKADDVVIAPLEGAAPLVADRQVRLP